MSQFFLKKIQRKIIRIIPTLFFFNFHTPNHRMPCAYLSDHCTIRIHQLMKTKWNPMRNGSKFFFNCFHLSGISLGKHHLLIIWVIIIWPRNSSLINSTLKLAKWGMSHGQLILYISYHYTFFFSRPKEKINLSVSLLNFFLLFESHVSILVQSTMLMNNLPYSTAHRNAYQ